MENKSEALQLSETLVIWGEELDESRTESDFASWRRVRLTWVLPFGYRILTV